MVSDPVGSSAPARKPRAGRNLPAAIATGIGLIALITCIDRDGDRSS